MIRRLPWTKTATCLLFYFSFLTTCYAQVVEVTSPDFDEKKTLTLDGGQTADVVVYLKSAGEMVNGIQVLLLDRETEQRLAVGRSNQDGMVLFGRLSAGKYVVTTNKTRLFRKTRPTVAIGDVDIHLTQVTQPAAADK